MLENGQCVIGLVKDGGFVIPHDVDGTSESVQCDQPAVAEEPYGPWDYQVFPVCEKHRHLVRVLYQDLWAYEARSNPAGATEAHYRSNAGRVIANAMGSGRKPASLPGEFSPGAEPNRPACGSPIPSSGTRPSFRDG